MATLVKEKRREKKKSKEKIIEKIHIDNEKQNLGRAPIESKVQEDVYYKKIRENREDTDNFYEDRKNSHVESMAEEIASSNSSYVSDLDIISSNTNILLIDDQERTVQSEYGINTVRNEEVISNSNLENFNILEPDYKELNRKLAIIDTSNVVVKDDAVKDSVDISSDLRLQNKSENKQQISVLDIQNVPSTSQLQENVLPSAPMLVEQNIPYAIHKEVLTPILKPKIQCIPIEKVLERSEGESVRLLSEKEETAVEVGPVSGPEHPLVDLLSTFRSSLIAVDRERSQLTCGFTDEERSRTALWKVEKRHLNISEGCQCGANIYLKASYEHAELLKDKLPVAKLKLESLLRDVQESYCHHQHEALLAYCQIEDLISETTKGNKPVIREALSLVLQTLRISDSAPVALASALQRWACALTEALADARDHRQLLFVIHHLFRQTRSVRWASRVIRLRVDDCIASKRVIAILDVLLARPKPRLDSALECTEEAEEAWEEVDRHGSGGAVSEGTLRERDLLALLYAFPLRNTVARLVHFTQADIKEARPHDWVSVQYGRATLEACSGVRVLLWTLRRAARVHAQYAGLRAALRALARSALVALSALHLHSRSFYLADLEDSVSANLEVIFAEGLELFGSEELYYLPTTLLTASTAFDFCQTIINSLHVKTSTHIESISVDVPVLSCGVRVRMVAQAAIDRFDDHRLAEILLSFLFQNGIKRKNPPCLGKCDAVASQWLPRVLEVHSYLYPLALHMIADLNLVEPVDPLALRTLSINLWRPNVGELRSVLDDWEQRCSLLMQHLLLELDYAPHTGVSYEARLTIGTWLCSWVRTSAPASGEWWWQVLRRLRIHKVYWGPPYDTSPPDSDPVDLFSKAYALCSTSWGHSIPMICSEGVAALCVLAATKPRDAAHTVAPVMALMSHSPESISLTPKFTELFSMLLSCRPSLVQRALGRGGDTGPDLLLRIVLEQVETENLICIDRGAVLRVWLHALWNTALPGPARGVVDTAAAACRHWPVLDAHAISLLQSENSKDYLIDAVTHAATAPLLCECSLRAAHARCMNTHAYALLLRVLANQRANSQRIHVDNALQQVGGSLTSEDLVIYQSAKAALVAPFHHPSQLMLWRLFMHLYLERPPGNMQDSSAPIGPLFYSGIVKSRALGHIKKCLQDTATYHHNEMEVIKAEHETAAPPLKSDKMVTTANISDDTIWPTLSIVDFTGESSDSETESYVSDNEDDQRVDGEQANNDSSEARKRDKYNLLRYHEGAEKMLREYVLWLEEGERVRALPHHADVGRYISEQALEAGWQQSVSRSRPPVDLESPTSSPAPAISLPHAKIPSTPFDMAVQAILKIKDRSQRRHPKTVFKSPLDDINVRDAKILLGLVDKHLQDIETLAKEWCSEVNMVSALDARLWVFVGTLRVQRALPPVKKQCPNKCKPINIAIPAQEWCISTGSERGIRENRNSARIAIRRLSRARPRAARSAATLHALVRRIGSTEAAVRVLERIWRSSSEAACASCPLASSALSSLTEHIAQRWVCQEGSVCAQLVSRWGRQGANVLQQAHCSALVVPRQLSPADWPLLYTALLQADLSHHLLFSCLSKFEMGRWSESAEVNARRDLLEALMRAVQRWGPVPEPSHHVLLELAGVHTRALLDAREICAHVVRVTRASIACTIPPSHWTHITHALDRRAGSVPFEKLGHLLRELGVMWWEARTGVKGVKSIIEYAAYAPYFASVLHALLRAFVAAALKLSYIPERVGKCAWSAVYESWGPWVSPHPAAPPLLPSTGDDEAYTPLLSAFARTILQIMLDCPGSEVTLLQRVWDWTIQTYLSVHTSGAQESRVQMSALLAELARLPWSRYQWCTGKCLQPALQISNISDKEVTSWCCKAWRNILADTWIQEEDERATSACLAPRLASLLYLFTGTALPHTSETFGEATKLPWWRLPGQALDEALERFFAVHHNPAQPYHSTPQFNVIAYASGLRMRPEVVQCHAQFASAREKRTRCVSQWVRCACAPTLTAHATSHSTAMLNTLTDLAPHLDLSKGEIEELMSRAIVIMCIEPAATSALKVWVEWVRTTNVRMVRACVSAAGVLTVVEYFAQIADASIRAFIDHKDGGDWEEVRLRLRESPWREAGPLVVRTRLYAAYASVKADAHDSENICAALLALSAANIAFNENDAIVAVWICVSLRACVHGAGASSGASEVARALLSAWATPPTRSLLRVVSLQASPPSPTPRHRLLCRFAQWILDPSETTAREYQAACASVPGSSLSDVSSSTGAPQPKHLARLAMRLYPLQEKYFATELKLISNINVT